MEWWQLWVPFGGTIAGIFANVYINYTQTKKKEVLQKEITQKQIDANLKAKARIEWIALVRGLVSEYISNYYKITVIVDRISKEEKSIVGNSKAKNTKTTESSYEQLIENNKDEIIRLKKELNESVSNSISISEQIFYFLLIVMNINKLENYSQVQLVF